jgi:hypothetical protein
MTPICDHNHSRLIPKTDTFAQPSANGGYLRILAIAAEWTLPRPAPYRVDFALVTRPQAELQGVFWAIRIAVRGRTPREDP